MRARRMLLGCRGWRFSGSCVSGIRIATATMSSSPYPATVQKIRGHCPTVSSHPPTMGAIAGAMEKIIITWLMSFCACAPPNRSRMTTRETTVAAPATSTCNTKPTKTHRRFGARAASTIAAAKPVRPAIITGLRPTASESGPWKMLITANATMYALVTCCIAGASTANSPPITPNAGNTVSIANGPIIARPARTSVMRIPARWCCWICTLTSYGCFTICNFTSRGCRLVSPMRHSGLFAVQFLRGGDIGASFRLVFTYLGIVANGQLDPAFRRYAGKQLPGAFVFGVYFGAQEQSEVGAPEPEKEDDHPGACAIGLRVVVDVRDVEPEADRGEDPRDGGEGPAHAQ